MSAPQIQISPSHFYGNLNASFIQYLSRKKGNKKKIETEMATKMPYAVVVVGNTGDGVP